MALPVISPAGFFTLVTTAIQALTTKVRNFTAGSVSGAIVNAVNAGLLQMQAQAVYLIAVSRAATSTGADLTSFVSDYGLSPARLPGVNGQGPLLFGRYSPPPAQVVVLVGTVAQNVPTAPNPAIQYQVIADVTNPNYNAGLGGYPIPAGQTSTIATVQALLPGTASNVLAGSLQSIVTPGTPADFVVQTADITNGQNQESDSALRVRFAFYVSGLAQSTVSAINAAVLKTQAGLTFTNNEYLDNSGNIVGPGYFTIVADDGSGSISGSVLTAISGNVTLARAEGISFFCIAPTNIAITIAVTGTVIQQGFSAASVRSALQAALVAYVNANGVGGSGSLKLPFAGVETLIGTFIGTGPTQGLAGFTAVSVNGGTSDIPLTTYQLARTSSGAVSVT